MVFAGLVCYPLEVRELFADKILRRRDYITQLVVAKPGD